MPPTTDRTLPGPPPADLRPELTRALLGACPIGRPLVVLAETTSTMDVAAELARHGAPDGTVVVADRQTTGRGRHGRTWLDSPGCAVLLSILFRPVAEAPRAAQLPMAVSLGALVALERYLGGRQAPALKWPNDLVVGDAKLGGLIAEATWIAGTPSVAIVGLGLNVSTPASALPPGAASLAALGAPIPVRAALIGEILQATQHERARLARGESLVPAWAARIATVGQLVEARTPTGIVCGRAAGVTNDGALTVRLSDGSAVDLVAADVTLMHH